MAGGLECRHQLGGALGQPDLGAYRFDDVRGQPREDRHPGVQALGEVQLAAHGRLGHRRYFLAFAGVGGQELDHFLLDEGGVHVHDEELPGRAAQCCRNQRRVDALDAGGRQRTARTVQTGFRNRGGCGGVGSPSVPSGVLAAVRSAGLGGAPGGVQRGALHAVQGAVDGVYLEAGVAGPGFRPDAQSGGRQERTQPLDVGKGQFQAVAHCGHFRTHGPNPSERAAGGPNSLRPGRRRVTLHGRARRRLSVARFFVLVSTPMSDVLEMAGVSVVRGAKTLLDKVDWQVKEGERWVILGPNGAGKTTLLQVAAARIHPTSGMAGILEEVLGAVDVFELRPRIGLSSAALANQIPEHEKVLNVVVTAAYGVTGRWREGYEKDDERRAFGLLNEWGMGPLLNRPFASLSEGERKRVQIARALMTDPELLLLDEPAAGLDLGGREDLVHRLSELAADDAAPAIVLVTHHLEEVPPGFTHALLMRDGGVVASGPLDQVLTAENLSETFGVDLDVSVSGGRYTATARR